VSQTGPLWPLGPVWLDQARTPTEFYSSSFPPFAGPPRCRPPVIPAGWWTMPPPGPPFRSQAPAPRPSHPPHRRPRRGRTPQLDQGISPEAAPQQSSGGSTPGLTFIVIGTQEKSVRVFIQKKSWGFHLEEIVRVFVWGLPTRLFPGPDAQQTARQAGTPRQL